MDNSRLFKVIYSNERSDRREMCSRLMKQFEGEKKHDSSEQKKEPMKRSNSSNRSAAAQFTKDSDHLGESVNISTSTETTATEQTTKTIDDRRPARMEIENAAQEKSTSGEDQRDYDMTDDEINHEAIREMCDAYPMSFGNDQVPSSSGSTSKQKKCLEKEIRPPDANVNSGRKDSLSTASNRSSLDPINEENVYDDLLISEKSDEDSSIEIEEIEAAPRTSRERTSSIFSNRSSLEPIQEDSEATEMDVNVSQPSSSLVESCEEVANEVMKLKPARTSKISLETITEEAGSSHSESEHDLIVRKHPLPFPSKQQEFSWFDLQSPMIKPSRKRRFEETEDTSFLMCSFGEENVSCEEMTLPYNVLDYRQSVSVVEQKDESKDESFSSPHFQSSANSVLSECGLNEMLTDLRSKVQRHEDSIRKISEALHASRGVNANLNEHLIHCHRNLLTERQSRQLLLEEIDRLERHKQTPRSLRCNVSCGNLVISNISLPLKPSGAQMSTEEPCDEEFYFICLLKCPSGRLVPSDMICVPRQSRRESVDFRARFSLSQVPSDFIIHLEIYTMTLIRRSITGNATTDASEVEDNVSISSSVSNLTTTSHQGSGGAKRFRFIKRLLTPSKSGKRQPAEGNDVNVNDEDDEGWRTTGFSILSSVKITRETVNQSEFSLGRIPHLYPLAGNLKVNISLNYVQENIEERGFLSVFSHVGGFGSWERLWCVLKPNRIVMWRYPDEEAKGVTPVKTIELDQCLSERAILASRDICFRPQTLVMRMTPSSKTDSKPVQLLLSADTKSDRVVWCNKINRCLNSLRSWNPSHFEEIQKRFCDH